MSRRKGSRKSSRWRGWTRERRRGLDFVHEPNAWICDEQIKLENDELRILGAVLSQS